MVCSFLIPSSRGSLCIYRIVLGLPPCQTQPFTDLYTRDFQTATQKWSGEKGAARGEPGNQGATGQAMEALYLPLRVRLFVCIGRKPIRCAGSGCPGRGDRRLFVCSRLSFSLGGRGKGLGKDGAGQEKVNPILKEHRRGGLHAVKYGPSEDPATPGLTRRVEERSGRGISRKSRTF